VKSPDGRGNRWAGLAEADARDVREVLRRVPASPRRLRDAKALTEQEAVMADADWAADLAVAAAAAIEAGRAIMRTFRTDMEVRQKAPDQPLTAADLEADRILHERLLGARPEYGWLSEETADDAERRRRARVWIVDPIDGTRSFIAGRREFGISIGVAEEGVAMLGVILNPATGELYATWRGGGAWKLADALVSVVGVGEWGRGGVGADRGHPEGVGEPVPHSPTHPLSPSVVPAWTPIHVRAQVGDKPVILASRSEIRDREFDSFAPWELLPLGSTTYKLARLAEGAADVFLSRGPKSEWDLCAGGLLVEEAGGVATDIRGEPLRYNRADPRVYGILAAPPAMHGIVLRHLAGMAPPDRLARPAVDPLHPGLVEEEDE